MPPRKREHDADSLNAPASTAPAKRQRVSLACDACRTAREKCDGGRPHCGTCTAQNRPCSYTPASRKRGVQTGYLRTIELSLAWLFEQVPDCEGALHRLLTQNDGADGTRILATKDKAGHRLYRRWSKSRVHKDIGRMLSDEKTPRNETSADDSETEESISPANANLFEAKSSPGFSLQGANLSQADLPANTYQLGGMAEPPVPTKLTLPPNWKRLIDIYFCYTHSWLPIVEREMVTSTALAYPSEGLTLEANRSSALHAQLWAVFAVSSFQDAASSEPFHNNGFSPSKIYSIARQLIPSDDESLEIPHISSLLLHSLVLLGQKKTMSAWLLIGKASRLALHGRATNSHMFPVKEGGEASLNHAEVRILAASFVLDSLASLCLGQSQVTSGIRYSLPSVTIVQLLNLNEPWAPVSGFGKAPEHRDESTPETASPLPTFQQLFAFCRLWAASMDARLYDSPTSRRITPEDLVRSLDAQFSFCNSLIFGGSTPAVPSAYLLQGMFLAITLDLVPGHRPSLFSNLIEVVESCLETFGPGGTPPIVVTLMEIVHRHGHSSRMQEHDKVKWDAALKALTDVWKPNNSGIDGPKEHQNNIGVVDPISRPIAGPVFLDEISTASHHTSQTAPLTSGELEHELNRMQQRQKEQQFLSYERQRYAGNSDNSPGTSQSLYPVTPNLTFQSPPVNGGHTGNLLQSSHIPSQLVDYDAILEELGSIDCGDSIEVDPQFMTNLGFAPGCDLGEMFHGDFGT
ncbi:hypothetical protein NW754_000585 [Fusarium falciforme]|nr:hypothetical protein NW754_000585 [Fusarium falciforme]KAJ4209741.1 hypothetical protein NW767_000018 [Fusarium falciforme]KAJ4255821.1 hypothetical protein NW757_004443 [Fusarium falciforme]